MAQTRKSAPRPIGWILGFRIIAASFGKHLLACTSYRMSLSYIVRTTRALGLGDAVGMTATLETTALARLQVLE
jgi:hypothetical protein